MIILNFQSLFYAQNLVPNWSFEIYDTCPTGGSQIHFASPWIGTNNSTDFNHACANANGSGYGVPHFGIYAKTGNGFAGI